MSKKTAFMTAYAKLSKSAKAPTARKDVLAVLASSVGISTACASTYLSNVQSGKWTEGSSSKKPAMTIEKIKGMANKELVATYNKKAAKPVVKFRDHATAVRRVSELYGLVA